MSVKKDVKMPVQGSVCSVALFAGLLLYLCTGTVITAVVSTLNKRSYMSTSGW